VWKIKSRLYGVALFHRADERVSRSGQTFLAPFQAKLAETAATFSASVASSEIFHENFSSAEDKSDRPSNISLARYNAAGARGGRETARHARGGGYAGVGHVSDECFTSLNFVCFRSQHVGAVNSKLSAWFRVSALRVFAIAVLTTPPPPIPPPARPISPFRLTEVRGKAAGY